MSDIGTFFAETARISTGESAGLTLRNEGGSMSLGKKRIACAIPVCTSCAAASISRSSENVIVMRVLPVVDDEVISSTPGI